MSVCSLRWFAEDVVKVARWVVREAFDEIDARLTPKHVQQGWDGFLAEEEAVRDSWEPGELRHRLYCNRCGGGYWTPEHNCGRDRSSEPPHLSWGVDGATNPSVSVAAAATDTPAPVETSSPSAGADPAGAPPPAPAGSPNLADLIDEVLAEHFYFYSESGQGPIAECLDPMGNRCAQFLSAHLGSVNWRAHVAPLIAERIEKATLPAESTEYTFPAIDHEAVELLKRDPEAYFQRRTR